jgi:hypothetical protein
MNCRLTGAVCLLALFITSPALAADYRIDLARHPGGEVTATVAPGRIRPVVLHRLPGRLYTVDVIREAIPVPVLTLPEGIKIPGGAAADLDCVKLKADVEKIDPPKDEEQVGAAVASITALLAETKCMGAVRNQVVATLAQYDNSLPQDEYVLEAGQRLRITIQRLDVKGASEKTWVVTLTTGPRGEWLTTYGLTFIPIRDELYFSKPTDQQGKYVISKQRGESDSGLRFLPSVLFNWMPANRASRNIAVSPTAGFGVNADSFGALAGATVTYNTNLGFTAGVAVVQQRRLLGKYNENDTVGEDLTEDQLHHRVLTARAFVAITFRFGANPFKESAGAEPAKAKDEPKKAEGDGAAAKGAGK